MKQKILTVITVAAGVILAVIGMLEKVKRSDMSISIIGGADGPTSVFLAGKVGNDYSAGLITAGIIIIAAVIVWWYVKRRK